MVRLSTPLRPCAASILFLLLAFAQAGALGAAVTTTPDRPNVVFIYADDLGYSDLGCYGAKDIRTPHIDRLATEGTRFTSFYVAQSVCTASRAALMTGSYPNRVGMSGALNHTSPSGLHTREKLLSQVFKDRGYATAAFGKWHLGHHQSIEHSGIRGIASRHGYRVEQIGLSLYHVREDPGETRDLAASRPEVVAQLQRVVAAARADLGDTLTNTKPANVRPAGDVRAPLPAGVKRVSNIEYSNPGSGALLLDLYLPVQPAAQPLPVVLWIHGGGWKSGSKENCPLTWLAAEGYAVASLGYRLSYMARWPAPLDDARAAIRWLRTNAARHQLDATRIAVAGGSSGGNLAGVVGTAPLPANETVSSRVSAVIDFYGASDVLTMPVNVPGPNRSEADLAQSNAAKLLGGIVRDRPELARAMSTLYQVSKDDPPFLIIHGEADPQVPLEQSTRLHAKLKETGVASELKVLPGAGHGGKAFDTLEVRETIRAFLRRSLTGN